MCDYDPPDCISHRQVKARKQHRCCECTRLMDIGEVHQVISGVWDGYPSRFRTCLSCVRLRDFVSSATYDGCLPAFGYLGETLFEAFGAYDDDLDAWLCPPLPPPPKVVAKTVVREVLMEVP